MRLANGHFVGPVTEGSEVELALGEQTTKEVESAKTVEVVAVAEHAVTLVQDGVAQVVVVVTPLV